MTESPPTEAAESSAAPLPGVSGLYDWLTTSDHKVIGRIWLRFGLLALLFSAVVGVLISIERLDADSIDVFGGTNGYFQMWSLYRFGMLLIVALPLFVGLATVVVPMQVGATNIAFPRAALAAAWGYVIGSLITVISVLAGGGWGATDGVSGNELDAMRLTLLGMGMVIVSVLLAAVCLATTVVSLRTSGMGLMKVPLFAWSMLIAASVWVLTLPVLLANIAIIYVDMTGGLAADFGSLSDGHFGEPIGLGVYGQLAWILEQPAVYIAMIPVLGIAGSIIPVVAKGRQVSHAAMVVLIGLAGLFAIGGWSQPAFGDNRDTLVYIAFGLGAVLPVLASLGGNGATLASGEAPVGIPPAHMIGALGSMLLLLAATTGGALRVIATQLDFLDLTLDSTATTGVMNLVVVGAVLAAIGGWWFWAPKTDGRLLSPIQGLGAMTLLLGGGVLLGATDVIAGFAEAPDVMLESTGDGLVDAMVVVSMFGSILVALGVLGVIGAVAQAYAKPVEAGDDPWDGHSLEWATSSPPPVGNFAEPPARVRSEAPLLDEAGDEGGES
ncbi:MAG: cbb3-type cytochrome c oxidase subunit I [Actinomycetota bacterium]